MRTWSLALWCVLCGAVPAAFAQQRPILTEDPETVGAGRVLLEAGLDHVRGLRFPVSGLDGNLTRLPVAGVSIGLSSIAELQVDGAGRRSLQIRQRLAGPYADVVAPGERTSAADDLTIGTKIRLVPEGARRPAVGARMATRLGAGSGESGLGPGTTDLFVTALAGKTIQSIRVVGNVGLGLLADPTRGDQRGRVLLYGASFARALTQAAEVVGEINGRAQRGDIRPPGSETRATLRFGGRYTTGPLRLDAAVLLGMTTIDAGVGVTAGMTYVFKGFSVP